MKTRALSIHESPSAWTDTIPTLLIGRIAEIDELGQAWVQFPGNSSGPVPADSVLQIDPQSIKDWIGRRVVLGFDGDESNPPIILGAVHSSFLAPNIENTETDNTAVAVPTAVDRKLTLTAQDQISLECGSSSLTMRKDGKIVIKGEQIVSRATGTNRIKGGSVAIN